METRKQWLASLEADTASALADKKRKADARKEFSRSAREANQKRKLAKKQKPLKPTGPVVVTDYKKYLRSAHWKRKRAEALKHYGNKCNDCGAEKRLQVHHKTYARLGCEEIADLELLCEDCHKARHPNRSANDALSREFRKIVAGF